jgi:hypothetical protein
MYNFVCEWEAKEMERERIPHPIAPHNHFILTYVFLLKFYEEDTSFIGNSSF